MINPKDSNLNACVWIWTATILILSGCSGPFDRKMGLSDLESPNTAVRIMAIKWAGDNKASSAIPQLVDFLHDEDTSVRFFAGLPPFLVPVVMRVSCTYSPCLEEGGA